MNCAEFQSVLPDVIDQGGNTEQEEHLRSCAVCSDLVQDLRYIAESARLLLPMQDPSPRVWSGIRTALEREGLVRPAAGTSGFRSPAAILSLHPWARGSSLLALAALLLFAIGMIWFRNAGMGEKSTALTASVPASLPATAVPTVAITASAVDEDDAQLLHVVQQRSPAMLPTYRENLNTVNDYIRDARRSVEQDPTDMAARTYLMRAYDQKALLYEMATYRSGE